MSSDATRSGPSPAGTRPLVAPELLAPLDAYPFIDVSDQALALIRSGAGRQIVRPLLSPAQQAVRCDEVHIQGPTGAPPVRLLVYMPPASTASQGAFLHMHGGGYVLGDPEINDGSNRTLVAELGCVVVSVDYRLAPETPAPGAVEDCYAALVWLHDHADQLGVDRSRIAIGGQSAGGGHAAALALFARERAAIPICLQMLDSPMLDDRTGSTAEPHPVCGEFVWTAAHNRTGWRALLGVNPGTEQVPAAHVPARVADLAGLPPAFISVGALDLFLEENLEYARRLIRAGVPTELHVIAGAFHGFAVVGEHLPPVQQHLGLCRDALARAFAVKA